MIKAILFDLGDVLLNVHKRRFASYIEKHSTWSAEDVLTRLMSELPLKQFEKGEISAEQFYESFKEKTQLAQTKEEFYDEWNSMFSLKKQSQLIVRKLAKDYRLILLSNTNPPHFEQAKKEFPMLELFHDYALSFECHSFKPGIGIYLDAIRKAKCKPWECFYVDDIKKNVWMARLLGIKAYHYVNAEKLRSDLAKHHVDATAVDIAALE